MSKPSLANNGPSTSATEQPSGPPYALAALVSFTVFAIYLVTIAPTTQFWDTSEYIAAAKVLGIPHPPGNPLFVLLAHVWGELPLVAHYALRINIFAALTSALTSGFLFLVAERFLRTVVPGPRWARIAAAMAGVLVGATSFTVWHQSVVNEKVYTLSLLSIGLVLWLVVHWGDEPAGERRDHWLILIVYVLALSATNHLMGLLAAPALAVYVLFTEPRAVLRWRLWLASALVVAVGISVWLILPIRAGFYPPINEGEPVCGALGTALQSIYTLGQSGCQPLSDVLNREQYQKGPLLPRQADLVWQYATWLQYFSWQFAHDLKPGIRNAIAALFGILGLVGAVRHLQRDRRGALAMLALMLTVTVALVFYLDFKHGYSMPSRSLYPDVLREVRERDYFFIASFHLWGIWVALGFGTLMSAIARFARSPEDPARGWAPALSVLLLALIPLVGNRLTASRAGETLARDAARDLLISVEPYSILITAGDNDTFPLWYMQEVEGLRRDVLLANTSLMNTQWHVRQLKRRTLDPFDEAAALPIHQGLERTLPAHDAVGLRYEEIDALPPFQEIRQRSVFQVGDLRAVIQPGYLTRADIVTLQLIQQNLGRRPIYFSRTTGSYPDQLGLRPYLLGEGLVRRLMPDTITADTNVANLGPLGWVDLARTETLLFDAYRPEAAARERPRGWIDEPSEGILFLYALMYSSQAQILSVAAADSTTPDRTAVLDRMQRATDIAERAFRQTSQFRNSR